MKNKQSRFVFSILCSFRASYTGSRSGEGPETYKPSAPTVVSALRKAHIAINSRIVGNPEGILLTLATDVEAQL
jgi:hypothetical protein